MCGLVGLIARKPVGFNSRELDLFEQMLMIDTLRGKDSTGVMSVYRDKDVSVIKTATQPFLMYETAQWGKQRNRTVAQGRFIAGHNRAATRGTINNDNAHPFVENHIILMHNGTLLSHGNLTTEKVEVDSHAIAHALATDDPDTVIPKINGAFALIWYNTETEMLYATRNDDRPLSIITMEDYYALSSEAWIAATPAARQNRKILSVDECKPGTLYSWNLKGELTEKELPKRSVVPYKHTYYGGYTTGSEDTEAEYREWLRSRSGGCVSPWNGDELGDCGTNESFTQGETKETETPPEIQNLRNALTKQAQEAQQRGSSQTPSNVCALTRPNEPDSTSPKKETGSTTTTSGDSNGKSNDTKSGPSTEAELERLESQQRSIIVDNPMFKKGNKILVKLWQVNRTPNGRLKWTGKVMQPDKEMLDCTGFLPDNVTPPEWPLWMEGLCEATVSWCTHTSGGPTVFVRDITRCEYLDVHGADIPKPLWDYAIHKCGCTQCQGKIEQWERLYVHVKLKSMIGVKGHTQPLNSLTVKCPDCLMKVLPDGEIYDRYTKGYYTIKNAIYKARQARARKEAEDATGTSAVSGGEQVGQEPVGKNGSTIAVPGPTTLQ